MGHHSLNSPSSFARRRACPGSASLEKLLPDSESVYAAEGSAAHNLGEVCLEKGASPKDFIGQKMGEFTHKDGTVEEFIVDGDMVDAVNVYVDYCRPLMTGQMVAIEERYQLDYLGEDESGSSDFTAIKDNILHVVDYKHGKGVAVDAYENIQGLNYALGAANRYDNYPWDKIQITIVQPRAFHKDGVIRSWTLDREDLFDWKLEFAEIAERTRSEYPEFAVSSNCRFCKAVFGCKAHANFVEEVTKMSFENPSSEPIDYNMLSDDEILDLVFEKIPLIEKWCQSVKDYAQKRAEEKNPLPGSKLVQTRERRMWANPADAEQQLGSIDGAYVRKFLTAPQMEKLLGKKKFAEFEHLVEKKSTGVVLVPEDDPRTSARPDGESEFGAVDINNLFG